MGTHFSSGVTNVFRDDEMGRLRTMDPSQYYAWCDDFSNYTAANWVVTNVGTTPTQAIVDGAGGILKLTATTGATDGSQLQWAGGSGAARLTVFWDSTKDLLMKTRFQVDSALNSGLLIGAAAVDTTLVASPPNDGIYFLKASNSTSLTAATRKSGTSSSITMGAMADATWVTASLVYNSTTGFWYAYLNGNPVGSIASTTNSPTNGLSVSIAQLNGSAAAHSLSVDYLNVFVSRV